MATYPISAQHSGEFALLRTWTDTKRRQAAALAVSVRVWLALLAFLAVVELFITLIGGGLERDPRSVLFSWPSLAIFGAAGLVGIWFSHRTGFPSAWDPRVSSRQRLVYPIVIGLAIGVLAVVLDLLTHPIQFALAESGMASFNVPFPGSLLFYAGGAILVEVLYRLLPIPVLLWLISNVALRGRGQTQIFWILALLSSSLEPLAQDLAYLKSGSLVLFGTQFGYDYAFNLAQVIMFRRYGFLAAILVRVAEYLVWHVAYGDLICRC